MLNTPEVRDRLLSQGVEPVGSTPQEFRTFIIKEMERYAQAAKAAGITPQQQ